MPLLSTNEIAPAKQYPPEREHSRVLDMERNYNNSRRVFDNPKVISQDRFTALERNGQVRLAANLYRLVMEFWQDAIIADRPVFEYEDGGRANDVLDAMAAPLLDAAEVVIGDMIRYGVGCFINRIPMAPQAFDPRFWFPVREAFDEQRGNVDIVAHPYTVNPQHVNDHLAVYVYENGRVSFRRYTMEGMNVGVQVSEEDTASCAMPIIPVRTGEGFYGTSDFADIYDYVEEIHVRESGIAVALDRHVNPHLAVPTGSIQINSDGQAVVSEQGMIIPMEAGEQLPSYVTWDPKFEAAQSAIDRAERRILQACKIAPILIQKDRSVPQLTSGAALRRLAIPTVNRIRLIRAELTMAIKQVIINNLELVGNLGGERIVLDPDKISMQWPPELSSGLTDEADALSLLVDRGILERETAIQLVERIRRSEAEKRVSDEQEPEPQPSN